MWCHSCWHSRFICVRWSHHLLMVAIPTQASHQVKGHQWKGIICGIIKDKAVFKRICFPPKGNSSPTACQNSTKTKANRTRSRYKDTWARGGQSCGEGWFLDESVVNSEMLNCTGRMFVSSERLTHREYFGWGVCVWVWHGMCNSWWLFVCLFIQVRLTWTHGIHDKSWNSLSIPQSTSFNTVIGFNLIWVMAVFSWSWQINPIYSKISWNGLLTN